MATDIVRISIVMPCRNEAAYIGACLDSVLANDIPKTQIEILVVDGMSDDGTRGIIEEYTRQHPCIRLLDNPKRITPAALNIGIAASSGAIVMRIDAHNVYPPTYIGGLVDWLERSGADNVGGTCITRPANASARARAIAVGLAHPFGVGNAQFRLGVTEPRWVDTVPFGCYRREVFARIGGFDEELVRNQDDELNHRLIKRGGRILLVPGLESYYQARPSFGKLWRMYYQYGYFKPLVARKIGGILTVRQLVPAIFVMSVVGAALFAPWSAGFRWLLMLILGAYAATTTLACARAWHQGIGVMLALTIVFPILHVSYGVGFLRGSLDFLLRRRDSVPDPAAIPISR